MKHLLLLLIMLSCVVASWAVPAERIRVKVRLTDGSELLVTSFGDEFGSWFVADDGDIVEPAEGCPGLFVRSQRTVSELVHEQKNRRSVARRIGSQATAPLPAKGSPVIPVVLVNFQDSVFSVGKTNEEIRAYYDLYCNGTMDGKRYTKHGSYGSVRDYFVAQSDSLFQPEFVVIGPVTLDNPVATYGRNSKASKDLGYATFRKEVIAQAVSMYNGDWSVFDNKGRGNGYVDMLFFIYAGCGENTVQENPDLIWPKESTSPERVTLPSGQSITISTFGCSPENRPKRLTENGPVISAAPDGIGVMCHELSHALGLPDFYDTKEGGTNFGMDVWSLMDYGCYMSNSKCPVAYTAYERDFMGWRHLQEISEAGPYTLAPIASPEGVGLKIVNPENQNEYYVLEARLNSGWDTALSSFGKGLQVTHVDYNSSKWNGNSLNQDAKHQRMTIIAANNNYNGSGVQNANLRETWAGNLFPFEQNDSLTANSIPAATVYTDSKYMPHSLTQIKISEDAQHVSFMLDGHLYDAICDLSDGKDSGLYSTSGIFDLTGRRIATTLRPGIYIRDGKKIYISK